MGWEMTALPPTPSPITAYDGLVWQGETVVAYTDGAGVNIARTDEGHCLTLSPLVLHGEVVNDLALSASNTTLVLHVTTRSSISLFSSRDGLSWSRLFLETVGALNADIQCGDTTCAAVWSNASHLVVSFEESPGVWAPANIASANWKGEPSIVDNPDGLGWLVFLDSRQDTERAPDCKTKAFHLAEDGTLRLLGSYGFSQDCNRDPRAISSGVGGGVALVLSHGGTMWWSDNIMTNLLSSPNAVGMANPSFFWYEGWYIGYGDTNITICSFYPEGELGECEETGITTQGTHSLIGESENITVLSLENGELFLWRNRSSSVSNCKDTLVAAHGPTLVIVEDLNASLLVPSETVVEIASNIVVNGDLNVEGTLFIRVEGLVVNGTLHGSGVLVLSEELEQKLADGTVTLIGYEGVGEERFSTFLSEDGSEICVVSEYSQGALTILPCPELWMILVPIVGGALILSGGVMAAIYGPKTLFPHRRHDEK